MATEVTVMVVFFCYSAGLTRKVSPKTELALSSRKGERVLLFFQEIKSAIFDDDKNCTFKWRWRGGRRRWELHDVACTIIAVVSSPTFSRAQQQQQ